METGRRPEEERLLSEESTDHERSNSNTVNKKEITEEVKKQLWLSGPLILVNVLQYVMQMISLMFVGHLGELILAGASMANSFAVVTGFSLLLGMACALETFCGQSYGARQFHMLGIHTQRAMVVLLLVSVPLAVIWAYTRHILVALGQQPDIADVAGVYARFMIPSLFAYGVLQCLIKFLQTQNIVFPMMICSVIVTLQHLLVCWLLVLKSGLGYKGAAVANCLSYWLNVALLALYIKFSPHCTKTWMGFSSEAFHGILIFFKLAVPSAIMVCLEMWSFEMMVLIAGLLPNAELETAVLSICLNTATTFWQIPNGLSGAISTRVSNELGANRPITARLAVWVVAALTLIEGIFVGVILIAIRNVWGYAYSSSLPVIKYAAVMLPLIAASHFLDGQQCILSGIARGCGWQEIGAYINLGSYYIVGLPSGLVFTFVLKIGGKGLYLGIICALVVQVSCLAAITIRTSWNREAEKASKRVHDAAAPTDDIVI